MKNNLKSGILPALVWMLHLAPAASQFHTVAYDPSRGLLNDGVGLPAETSWMVTGPVADRIGLVEVRVFEDEQQRRFWASGRWERTEWSAARSFQAPMDRPLRGNTEYTVVLAYYQAMPDAELTDLADLLSGYLTAYIDESVEVGSRRTRLRKPVARMMQEMDRMVERATSEHRSRLGLSFQGFSQLVHDKLRSLDQGNLSVARFNFKRSEEEDKGDARVEYARQRIGAVKELVTAEARMYLARETMVMRDRSVVTMSSERTMNLLSVNLGYAGIYLDGPVDDIAYGESPFLGVSLPLGRRAFSSAFLSNSSLSAGVFLNGFAGEPGVEYDGPIIGRPLYLAYGYRILRMVRLNAGATLLQQNVARPDGGVSQSLLARPFIGASIEFNLWMGLGQ